MATRKTTLEADGLLFLTAADLGLRLRGAAERHGGHRPVRRNGAVRFALGAGSLVPLFVFMRRRRSATPPRPRSRAWRVGGAGLAGLVLFAGASFQQVGLVHTTAANAGFELIVGGGNMSGMALAMLQLTERRRCRSSPPRAACRS